jgi:DNA polymerase-3 subunit epsilon
MHCVTKTGVIWDVETTGLDAAVDVPIEVGAVKFEWTETVDEAGVTTEVSTPRIVAMYGGLCDPGREVPSEITALTGITNDEVKGKTLDLQTLHGFARDAWIHVAHNASFDKQFLKRTPFFEGVESPRWACTIKHIDWAAKGFKSTSLVYLGADHGFVNPFAHRALFDCASTFRIMQPHFQELLKTHTQKMFTVHAWNSAFHTKDLLKERKYYWDAGSKVWKKDIIESKVPEETEFLRTTIYQSRDWFPAEFKEITE